MSHSNPHDPLIPTPSPAIRAFKDVAYGSIAGMVAKVFEHPFDLAKVRLQSQFMLLPSPRGPAGTIHFRGPWHCLSHTYIHEGLRGLYRGLPAPVLGSMAENASLFLSYTQIQQLLISLKAGAITEADLGMRELCMSAAGAGAITSFVLTPIELIKCKMQVQMLSPTYAASRIKPPGPIQVLLATFRQTGLRGMWLGHTGTFIRETGGTVVWFGTKEGVGRWLVGRRQRSGHFLTTEDNKSLRTWESAFSGACAGAAFNLAFFPADTVKSAMQTVDELRPSSPASPASSSPSFLQTTRNIIASSGLRGLYAGCGITIARSVVSSGMIFVIWDGLRQRFG